MMEKELINVRTDLHIHTNVSDGSNTPKELIKDAINEGIELMAVTDHDTTANVEETKELALDNGIAFLTGVEITSTYKYEELHILAYGIDINNPILQSILEYNQQAQDRADIIFLRQLLKTGRYSLDIDNYSYYENPSGNKLYNFLRNSGIAMDEKFGEFCDENDINYVELQYTHPALVTYVIKEAGGVSILAHPGGWPYRRSVSYLLETYSEFDIDGVECIHPSNNEYVTKYCKDWCNENDKIITGGSDTHGNRIRKRRIGKPVITTDDLRLGSLTQRIIMPRYTKTISISREEYCVPLP